MKNIKLFEEFINEYSGYQRYPMSVTKIVNILKDVNKLYADCKFMVPADYLGHSSVEVDLKEAIDILKKHEKDHKNEKDPVEFYIWHVEVKNQPSGFDKFDIIKKGAKGFKDFSKKYARIFDNSPYITKVNISMESKRIEQFGRDMSAGKYGSLD